MEADKNPYSDVEEEAPSIYFLNVTITTITKEYISSPIHNSFLEMNQCPLDFTKSFSREYKVPNFTYKPSKEPCVSFVLDNSKSLPNTDYYSTCLDDYLES